MGWWGGLLSHVRSMAIGAAAGLLQLREFFLDSSYLRISRFLAVLVTSSARGDWDVGRESTQSACARNLDMAGRALHYVFAFATFMAEHRRLTCRQIDPNEPSRSLVATGAVVAGWLLTLPMSVETRVVSVRHGFEKSVRLCGTIGRRCERRDICTVIRLVTD